LPHGDQLATLQEADWALIPQKIQAQLWKMGTIRFLSQRHWVADPPKTARTTMPCTRIYVYRPWVIYSIRDTSVLFLLKPQQTSSDFNALLCRLPEKTWAMGI
jgi:hypothetical protein